jgi:hypothetical protein
LANEVRKTNFHNRHNNMAPEQISNQDGTEKQDCEINAGKRCIQKIRKTHPKLNIIITADGLYSKQPFINGLKKTMLTL